MAISYTVAPFVLLAVGPSLKFYRYVYELLIHCGVGDTMSAFLILKNTFILRAILLCEITMVL